MRQKSTCGGQIIPCQYSLKGQWQRRAFVSQRLQRRAIVGGGGLHYRGAEQIFRVGRAAAQRLDFRRVGAAYGEQQPAAVISRAGTQQRLFNRRLPGFTRGGQLRARSLNPGSHQHVDDVRLAGARGFDKLLAGAFHVAGEQRLDFGLVASAGGLEQPRGGHGAPRGLRGRGGAYRVVMAVDVDSSVWVSAGRRRATRRRGWRHPPAPSCRIVRRRGIPPAPGGARYTLRTVPASSTEPRAFAGAGRAGGRIARGARRRFRR